MNVNLKHNLCEPISKRIIVTLNKAHRLIFSSLMSGGNENPLSTMEIGRVGMIPHKNRLLILCMRCRRMKLILCKLNTDGACKGSSLNVGGGSVIQDSTGRWIFSFAGNSLLVDRP